MSPENLTASGYHIDQDRLIREGDNYYFFIRNRKFEEIDHTYRHLLTRGIKAIHSLNPSEPVKILDLGGGSQFQAVSDIAERFGSSVETYSIDLIVDKDKCPPANCFPQIGDLTDTKFPDKSFDIIFSRQVLMYYSENHELQTVLQAIRETSRLLKPGGFALLDDEYFSNLPKISFEKAAFFLNLYREFSINAYFKEFGLFLRPLEQLDRLVNPWRYPNGDFLILAKNPISHEIAQILKQTPKRFIL